MSLQKLDALIDHDGVDTRTFAHPHTHKTIAIKAARPNHFLNICLMRQITSAIFTAVSGLM
jgi:hypothetical protein